MNFEYTHLLPEDFSSDSRVWIYQSSRMFLLSEAIQVEDLLNHFSANWKSHGTPVKGFGTLLFGQFIVLMADETATGVSGCSTDSSVRLMKDIETLFKVQLFDRQSLAFIVKEKIELLPLSQVQYALNNQFIKTDTIFFNNTVQTKQELLTQWMVPLKESWLGKRLEVRSEL
jgi:hypothetical protein